MISFQKSYSLWNGQRAGKHNLQNLLLGNLDWSLYLYICRLSGNISFITKYLILKFYTSGKLKKKIFWILFLKILLVKAVYRWITYVKFLFRCLSGRSPFIKFLFYFIKLKTPIIIQVFPGSSSKILIEVRNILTFFN